MFKYVLSMILFGGLLGGGLIGGCGEESKEEIKRAADGGDEGEGGGSQNEGEGEGSTEGEGEDPMPPGADGEPCGDGNTCQDGLECGAEEANICTCPQWFGGRWWAEFDVRAVGYEYDFSRGNVDQEFWSDTEIQLTQDGCSVTGPTGNYAIGREDYGPEEGGRFTPPYSFLYKKGTGTRDGDAWITFTGNVVDRRAITGNCEGTYPDRSTLPHTFFRVTCTFSLTRR